MLFIIGCSDLCITTPLPLSSPPLHYNSPTPSPPSLPLNETAHFCAKSQLPSSPPQRAQLSA